MNGLMSLLKKLLKRTVSAVLIAILVGVAGLVAVLIVIPKVMGWIPLTVLTGSMRPTIPPGSTIVVKPIEDLTETRNIGLGDVITFMPEADNPMLVTHRVIAVHLESDGNYSFSTKGDNNPSPDKWTVQAIQIRGTVLYHIPVVGYLPNQLSMGQKGTGLSVVAIVLFLYGVWQIVPDRAKPAVLKRRATKAEGLESAEPSNAVAPQGDETASDGSDPVQLPVELPATERKTLTHV